MATTPFSARAERVAEATRARANVLVASLVHSISDDTRSDALDQLNSVADNSYGADAAALAAAVRESGGIRALIACINTYDGDPTKSDELPQGALALVGNLLTDVFDPEAVILGGGFASVPFYWKTMLKTLHDSDVAKRKIKVIKAKLGDNAGLIGAALI
jgi:hypothetical protein